MPKNPPVQKISKIEKLFENSIFYLKGGPKGKKIYFKHVFSVSNWQTEMAENWSLYEKALA